MDIQGLGPKYIKQLVDEGILASPVDIFKFLRIDDQFKIMALPGWSDGRVNKIVKSIKERRVMTAAKFYMCLGIPSIGESKSVQLTGIADNPLKFIEMVRVDDDKLSMIGYSCLGYIKDWYLTYEEEFHSFIEQVSIVAANTAANQKTFLFTGKLSRPRPVLEDDVRQAGHIAAKSLSRKVDYLVVGDKAGNKLNKAKQLGITVIDEEKFRDMIK